MVHFKHHCRKLVQIGCQKGAGTKMHICLFERVIYRLKWSRYRIMSEFPHVYKYGDQSYTDI